MDYTVEKDHKSNTEEVSYAYLKSNDFHWNEMYYKNKRSVVFNADEDGYKLVAGLQEELINKYHFELVNSYAFNDVRQEYKKGNVDYMLQYDCTYGFIVFSANIHESQEELIDDFRRVSAGLKKYKIENGFE